MHRLSPIIVLLGLVVSLQGQSPHGAALRMDCAACHNSDSWEIPRDSWGFEEVPDLPRSEMTGMPLTDEDEKFNHFRTNFPLTGQHSRVDCRSCHETLVFAEAEADCISCHTDIHRNTVGSDCARCHSPESWLVDNITELHEENGFPLLGNHAVVNCNQCHVSESNLEFNRIGNDCINCHLDEFNATTNPNHQQAGFSMDCAQCHQVDAPDWSTERVNHDFFPLTKGHEVQDCAQCHQGGDFANTPTDCFACHETNFENTLQPDHQSAGFPTDCAACHTTDIGWMPAEYRDHDPLHFPIYSGEHEGEWMECADCHNNSNDFGEFTCINCHTNPETDDEHGGVGGYVYQDIACLACHPNGEADNPFDHNNTAFPLTGEHLNTDCLQCHADGFAGTPTECAACHTNDFNATVNPDHVELAFPTDCASCHTTEPEWMPATFDIHDQYYALHGAHAAIADDCAACHNGDYTNTPNTCFGCHSEEYNATTDPDHAAEQFPQDCTSCHSEDAWIPAAFDHDQHFPLTGAHLQAACLDCHSEGYEGTPTNCAACHHADFDGSVNPNHQELGFPTDCAGCHTTEPGWSPATFDIHNEYYALNGAHAAIANECATCHNGDYNNTPNTCAGCHTEDFNQTTEPNHLENQFPTDCASCHTEDAWIPSTFDHNQHFPLDGGHAPIANDCVACHNGDYANTPNTCAGCHTPDFNNTVNPNHQQLAFPTDCASCHTTQPDWMPATFDIHDEYYALNGAHAAIANDCAACHNGDYNNTPNTCFGCHGEDYNNTSNPDHQAAQFPTDCVACHSEDTWVPATLDHDGMYFPIYSGDHEGEWSACTDCHTNPSNYAEFTCTTCHVEPETTEQHNGVGGFVHESNACLACHPTGNADEVFDHNQTAFPLTGAHIETDCLQCHQSGFEGTPTDCAACHTTDFNNTSNPNHQDLGFAMDCASCHSTEPGWSPAAFDNHDEYYALNGAHAAIANECATCHNGDYNNTPNTCAGCHTEDFNQTTEPNHLENQFPTDCASCHTEDAWIPSTFDHNQHFPLDGGHAPIANDCVACHNGDYTNTPNTCAGCHTPDFNNTVNPNHQQLAFPTDCASCHTTQPDWMPATFDIHDEYYALNGAHAAIANDCAACHNGDYNNTPNTCFGCHSEDYNATTNPNHADAQFPTDCASCHSEDTWVPATLDHDGMYFPIYSGDHEGEWSACTDCHTNPSNYAEFTCTTCHVEPETTEQHNGVGGFVHESNACLACHPTGNADEVFDHNQTAFPLTGAHIETDCLQCHQSGFEGTPTDCAACHTTDFNNTSNPNHQDLGFAMDCASCHSTEPGWSPAAFDNHDEYYALNGAHAAIANECATCHNGDYNNTPNTCAGCHTEDFNQTTEPNHLENQFPTDCASCHTEDAWIPSTFDHNQHFPLDGGHAPIANDCVACHNGDYANTPNTCAGCHTPDFNNTVNPNHQQLGFPTDCASCHTTQPDWMPATFDIHDEYYALNGAHAAIANDCAACHNGDYNNTPNTCFGCHSEDYNATTNPNHADAQFPTDCASCHTESSWVPANFDHDQFYPIVGAHEAIADDCAACHNGDFNNTPNTCVGCHLADYNATVNPDHASGQFPQECESCHTQDAWIPSTFDHDQHFPLDGGHALIANDCVACHNGDYTNTPNTCAGCHTPDFNNTVNPNHQNLAFPTDCASCHTTQPDWMPATFEIHDQYYVLNGAHSIIANDCAACHNGDYNNTPNTCFGCHSEDYNATTNPNHADAQFPTDCAACHGENAWIPASFDHDQIYPIVGAHVAIENDCNACHNGDFNNTPNTCFGCHSDDYNNTNNPNHAAAGFPTTCEDCHNQNTWEPSTFDHDGMYFPIYDGKHEGEWNTCTDCHFNSGNFAVFSCIDCHEHDNPVLTAEIHEDVGAYMYESNACFACHPNGED